MPRTRQHLGLALLTLSMLSFGFLSGLLYASTMGNPLATPTPTTNPYTATDPNTDPLHTPATNEPSEDSAPTLHLEVVQAARCYVGSDAMYGFGTNITNNARHDLTLYTEDFQLEDANGTVWDSTPSHSYLNANTLRPGGRTQGEIWFQANRADAPFTLHADTEGLHGTVTVHNVTGDHRC